MRKHPAESWLGSEHLLHVASCAQRVKKHKLGRIKVQGKSIANKEGTEMRWVVIFVLLLALAGCEAKPMNGFVTPVIYETSGYGAHTPVKAVIEYANESGDTMNIGEDPDWVDLPWAYYFTIPRGAMPTLYLHVETIEGGDSVRAKIFVDGETVAQDSGSVVTLTYHP